MAPMISAVEPATSAIASTADEHSGCASTTAPGCRSLAAVTDAGEMSRWMGQHPGLRMTRFSGTCSATKRPRFSSGMKSTERWGSARTTATALDEVTHTSERALSSAVEFT